MNDEERPGRRERALALAPWLLGLAGALLFLRPLAGRADGAVLERVFWYDALILIDSMSQFLRNLAEGPQVRGLHDWLYAAPFFHPQPQALATSEVLQLPALVSAPFAGAPVLAYNVGLFLAIVLGVVGAASFARALGAAPLAASVAGVAFTFSAYVNFSSGRAQLVWMFPSAFALAACVRWARDGKLREAALASIWIAAQAFSCLYYALFLALLLPPFVLVLRLANPRAGATRELARFAGVLALGALPVALLLWPYRSMTKSVGLARPIAEVVEQSGDPMMFLWADKDTLWGKVLPDVYRWDTAYFFGGIAILGSLWALAAWIRRDARRRGLVVALVVVAAVLSRFAGYWLFVAAAFGAIGWLVREARAGRTSALAPALATLVLAALVVFSGPYPRYWTRPVGPSPYLALYEYAPVVSGIRMTRRAGLFVQLAVCALAALAFSRLERRRFGSAGVLALAGLALVEGMPFGVGAHPVATACTDAAYEAAKKLGARIVGEHGPRPFKDHENAEARHLATVCGMGTNLGHAGFTPAVVQVATDALESLPDPVAHARAWDAGFHHLVLRAQGNRSWVKRRLLELAPVTERFENAGADAIVVLRAPAITATLLDRTLPDRLVLPREAECSVGTSCAALKDGRLETRWSSDAMHAGGEQVTLRFDRATVTGLVWENGGDFGNQPYGLEIESADASGEWRKWAEFPAISFLPLGREAVHARLAIPLPEREITAIRLTQRGTSTKFWLSASEVRIAVR